MYETRYISTLAKELGVDILLAKSWCTDKKDCLPHRIKYVQGNEYIQVNPLTLAVWLEKHRVADRTIGMSDEVSNKMKLWIKQETK